MRTELQNFLDRFPYPQEAKATLLQGLDQILSNADAAQLLLAPIEAYKNGETVNFADALGQAGDAGKAAGVHEYTAKFLLFACLGEFLRLRYKEKGIDQSIWYDSMMDLIYKLNECHAVYGIWGSFVTFWFDRFFHMTRFALGRLQFETTAFYLTDSYSGHGCHWKHGEGELIGVHIPSGKRLAYEDVLDSYRRAYQFYNHLTVDGLLPIICESWLLYDGLEEFLPKESNILRFKQDFEILKNVALPAFEDCWRIFDMQYTGDPATLPRNTSLQRRYADWISSGGVPGSGYGILWFDGEKVVK